MIKFFQILLTGLLLLCSYSSSQAQFLTLDLKIEPELRTSIDQELNFGTLATNSGEISIALGDLNMGIFRIRAFKTQNVHISLVHPTNLTRDGISANLDEYVIPLDLYMAYNYSDNEDYLDAKEIPNNMTYLPISEIPLNGVRSNSIDNWKELLVFLYGSILIDNIPSGNYSALVTLVVDYD